MKGCNNYVDINHLLFLYPLFQTLIVSNFDPTLGGFYYNYDPLIFFVNHCDTYLISFTRDFEVHMAYDISCCLHARDELSNYIYHKIIIISYHCISFWSIPRKSLSLTNLWTSLDLTICPGIGSGWSGVSNLLMALIDFDVVVLIYTVFNAKRLLHSRYRISKG